MENTGGVKYEQENLLDKFIHNEKKAKLWAAISLLAFFVAATTVIVVAYQIKNSNGQQSSGYVTDAKKNDTLLVQEPGKTVVEYQNEITQLTNYVQQYKDSMNYLYTIINGYAAGTRNADSLINLLNDCQSKLQTNNPSVPDISVIVYTSSMPDTSIGKLQKIMPGYGPEKDKLNVTIQPVTNGSKPHIRYSDSKYRTTAEYLSTVLNRSNGFRNLNKLVVVPGTEANMKANIEIWLGVVY